MDRPINQPAESYGLPVCPCQSSHLVPPLFLYRNPHPPPPFNLHADLHGCHQSLFLPPPHAPFPARCAPSTCVRTTRAPSATWTPSTWTRWWRSRAWSRAPAPSSQTSGAAGGGWVCNNRMLPVCVGFGCSVKDLQPFPVLPLAARFSACKREQLNSRWVAIGTMRNV